MAMMDENKTLGIANNLLDNINDMGDDEVKDAISDLEKLIDRLKGTLTKRTPKDVKLIRRLVLTDAAAVQTQSQKLIKVLKITVKD
jgi:hypothetical protein